MRLNVNFAFSSESKAPNKYDFVWYPFQRFRSKFEMQGDAMLMYDCYILQHAGNYAVTFAHNHMFVIPRLHDAAVCASFHFEIGIIVYKILSYCVSTKGFVPGSALSSFLKLFVSLCCFSLYFPCNFDLLLPKFISGS
jgi:hypothetical protein